jgi:asparagine synthase (glutamine-hydrolysing)
VSRKKDPFSLQEDILILEKRITIGNKWSEIAGDISGLTGYHQMYSKFAEFNGFISPIEGFIGIAQRSDLDSGLFKIRREVQDAVTSELVSFIAPTGVDNLSELHNSLLRYEVGKFLPSLLHIEDRVTMAHGLEARVPILSKKMLEFVLPLPLNVRMTGGKPKDLMRMAAKGNLPVEVIERTDKMGFPVPLDVWSQGDAKSRVAEEISELRARDLPFIQNGLLDSIVKNQDLGNRSLWACISLNTWLKNLED